MKNNSENLFVFGYGLSLLIPYLVLVHWTDVRFGFMSLMVFLAGFAFILWLIVRLAKVRPVTNVWILALPMAAFLYLAGQQASWGALAWIILAGSIALLTIINAAYLGPVYSLWMKLAHVIGGIILTAVLVILFFLVFGIIGIILRLIRKDLLKLKPDRQGGSYWAKREKEEFKPENYLRQF